MTFGLRVSQSQAFYHGYLALRDADRQTRLLSDPRRRVLTSTIRSAEQSGVGLAGASRERFNAIQQELAKLSTSFSHNLLDAVNAYTLASASATTPK